MVIGIDRFPELVYKVGKCVGEKPKAFFLWIDVGNGLQPSDNFSR